MPETQTSSIDVDASAEDLFDIVTDVESYPQWVTGVQSVDVLETTDDGHPERVSMVVDVGVRVLRYTLRFEYDYPTEISWSSEPGGDVREIDGSYVFHINDAGGTTVTYTLFIDPGFPVPGFMLRQAERHLVTHALDGLKHRAES